MYAITIDMAAIVPNHAPNLPNPTATLHIILSDIDLDDDKNYQIAKFYMTRIVPKVTGAKGWSDTDHVYMILSEARWPEDTSKLLVHPYTEPFAVVLIMNHLERWAAQRDMFRKDPTLTAMPRRRKTNKDLPIYQSRYSSQDRGQKILGGWGKLGIDKFNQLVTTYVAKKYEDPKNPDTIKKEWLDWEKQFKDLLRKENNIKTNSAAAEKSLKARGSTKPEEEIPEIVGGSWNL